MPSRPSASPPNLRLAPIADDADRRWLADLWQSEWGGSMVVSRGQVHDLAEQETRIAWRDGTRAGAVTYRLDGDECEVTSISATVPRVGVGTALLAAAEAGARAAGCRRVWLITTNDNLDALRFYQRRGYRLVAVYPDSIDVARQIKPNISLVGNYGIPIRDEVELEKRLTDSWSS
jgi:ribosomal protein S18 acetylase RimI-like enzyme